MLRKLLLILSIFPLVLIAGKIELLDGQIKAHTEVFGDSTIDPSTNHISTNLFMDSDITSIKGLISTKAASLISDNKDRDKHMYEALSIEKYPDIKYNINNVTKTEDGYFIDGVFELHGINKHLKVKSNISKNENGLIHLKSKFTIKTSEYEIEPITLLFLTVRDEVDINVSLTLKEK